MSKVLVLRSSKADGISHGGFQWPKEGPVECSDWNPAPVCRGGLHGLAWGDGDWSLLNHEVDALWQVVEVDAESVVKIDAQKVKFQRGMVVYSGGMGEAINKVLNAKPNFERVFAEAKEKSSGYSSKAASSGYYSTAASSGYCSKAASSGDYSTAASSGYCSKAASSGCSSKAASSGDYSTAASSGDYSTAASSGYSSKAASSGYYSTAASSGYCSKAASSGDSSTAASSGDYSTAASSGYSSKAASSGYYSTAASSGYCSKAASSGDSSTAASSGYSSKAASSGRDTVAMAAGLNCVVSAGESGCFASCWWDEKAKRNRIKVGYVGVAGILANTPYRLTGAGKWEEAK